MAKVRDGIFSNPRLNRAWELTANVTLMVIFGFFAYRFALDFINTQRPSSLILLLVHSIVALLNLIRRLPVQVSIDPFAWTVAIAGTWLPLFLRPVMAEEIRWAQVLLLAGIAVQVVAISSLARSLGTVAANRGIKTGGLYRFVRHPIYSAYLLTHAGFLINQYSLYNAITLAFWLFFQLLRIKYEEDLLLLDPEYVAYAKSTRWRLVPLIF